MEGAASTKRKTQKAMARSGKGTCPTCGRRGLLVMHHIGGRDIPGWNKWWNEVMICPYCHFELHSQLPGRLVIEGWESTTAGRELVFRRGAEAAGGESERDEG